MDQCGNACLTLVVRAGSWPGPLPGVVSPTRPVLVPVYIWTFLLGSGQEPVAGLYEEPRPPGLGSGTVLVSLGVWWVHVRTPAPT